MVATPPVTFVLVETIATPMPNFFYWKSLKKKNFMPIEKRAQLGWLLIV
jgi:hypothetical protein